MLTECVTFTYDMRDPQVLQAVLRLLEAKLRQEPTIQDAWMLWCIWTNKVRYYHNKCIVLIQMFLKVLYIGLIIHHETSFYNIYICA